LSHEEHQEHEEKKQLFPQKQLLLFPLFVLLVSFVAQAVYPRRLFR